MNRREYLEATGVVCGAVGLSGCGLLGGGSSTPTEDDGPATGTIDLNDGTATPTTPTGTPVPQTEQLTAALDAKATAIDSYESGVEAARRIDDSDSYDFNSSQLSSAVDSLQSASETLDSEAAVQTLSTLADYLDRVASALETAADGVAELSAMITDLTRTAILPTGTERLATLDSIRSTFSQVLTTLDGTSRDGLSVVNGVLSREDIDRVGTSHQAFVAQMSSLRTLAEGLQAYHRGTNQYVAGGDHRETAQEAGQQDPDTLGEELRAAIADYKNAETTLTSAESTLVGTEPNLTGDLATQFERLECRAGAFAEASTHWQRFAQLIIDRAAESEIDAARAAAASAVQQCATN